MLKILGQVRPVATVATNLVTMGVGESCVCGSVIACNTDATVADEIVIYQIKSGGSPGVGNIIYMATLPAKESFTIVAGLSLTEGEKIFVKSTNGTTTFTVSGNLTA